MTKKFNNKYFQIEFIARKDLHYGQWLTPVIYFHNRGVYYIGKFLGRKIYFPYLLTSFRFEILWFRYAIGIDFVKWKNYDR